MKVTGYTCAALCALAFFGGSISQAMAGEPVDSQVFFAEDLLRELSKPDIAAKPVQQSYTGATLLEPISNIEQSELTLIMFCGLVLIFTIRVFFAMHEKNKRAERDTYAYDLHSPHGGSQGAAQGNRRSPHHQRRRKTVSIPMATMSVENLQCSIMYGHQPHRSRRHRTYRRSLAAR
jgi:hypothetical protein